MHAVKRIGPSFKVVPLDKSSPYVKPFTAVYDFDGACRSSRACICMHDPCMYMHAWRHSCGARWLQAAPACARQASASAFVHGASGGGGVPVAGRFLSCRMPACAGKPRTWEIIESHASVGVVLYHADMDAWLLVRQFRPAVYASISREAQAAGQPEPPLLAGQWRGQPFDHSPCTHACMPLPCGSKTKAGIACCRPNALGGEGVVLWFLRIS